MFATLSFLTAIFCGLEGLRKTADCLSEEKREGTLGLLFLTDLKGYDVILGKLSATSLNSIYGLLAMLPILALSLVLGGVTPGEFWRMALALANLLFFSLCAGIWVSARSQSERNAVTGTGVLISSFLFVPWLTRQASLYVISPGFAYHSAFEAIYLTDPDSYWRSLLITQLFCWSLLAWASWTIRWSWQDKLLSAPAMRWQEWRQHRKFGNPSQRAKLRAQLLDINPALWLASRNIHQRLGVWGFVGILPVAITVFFIGLGKIGFIGLGNSGFLGFIVAALLVNFILQMRLGTLASHSLAEARRDNGLEILLSTPLSADQIIHGHILALKRVFLAAILTALSLEILGLIGGAIAMGREGETMIVSIFLRYRFIFASLR
jgi:ABC-type Na+ efflux pump permease subunit